MAAVSRRPGANRMHRFKRFAAFLGWFCLNCRHDPTDLSLSPCGQVLVGCGHKTQDTVCGPVEQRAGDTIRARCFQCAKRLGWAQTGDSLTRLGGFLGGMARIIFICCLSDGWEGHDGRRIFMRAFRLKCWGG
ncbi:hypothetical protein BJX62DRAFT_65528 [Aspergillus germanicus]